MIYPCDARTATFLVNYNSSVEILPATSTPRTILSTFIQNTGPNIAGQAQSIKADGVFLNFIGPTSYVYNPVTYSTYITANDLRAYNSSLTYNAYGQVVFVERNIASTTEPILCAPSIPAATGPTLYNGFTQGEIITTLFLFLSFMCFVFTIFIIKVTGIKTKK